jgi:hypothetical protein
MPKSETSGEEGQLYTHVDDEQYEELSALNGQRVLFASVWEEGLADSLAAINPATPGNTNTSDEVAADIDLYLADGVYFELYGTLCYTDLDAPPLSDLAQIEGRLQRLVKAGVKLEEVAVDEEDGLVLVLAQHHKPVFFLQVGAWLLDEWEELPEASTP